MSLHLSSRNGCARVSACEGGKDIEGVWRKQFFLGPTTATKGFEFSALAVQLVR